MDVLSADAGILLLAVAWDDDYPRGTVHVRTDDGNIATTCPSPDGPLTYDIRSGREDLLLPRPLQPDPHDVVRDRRAQAGRHPAPVARASAERQRPTERHLGRQDDRVLRGVVWRAAGRDAERQMQCSSRASSFRDFVELPSTPSVDMHANG